jgi:ankyrin repeat protein
MSKLRVRVCTYSWVCVLAAALFVTGCAKTMGSSGRGQPGKPDLPLTPEALLSAARGGRADEVRLLLEGGVNPNAQDEYGATALIEAAQQGHAEVIRILIRAKANVDYQPPKGDAALIEAAADGHLEATKALVEAGANLNLVGKSNLGGTALARAASLEHWEVVKLLLDAGADPNASGNVWPALAPAAEKNQETLVKLLLEKGADPNYRFPGGATVLWQPVWQGHTAVVRLLLEAGARVPEKDRKILLAGLGGKPVKPEIKKMLLHPPKVKKRFAQSTTKKAKAAETESADESTKAKPAKQSTGDAPTVPSLGQATGALVMNKQETPLTHSYAFVEEGSSKKAAKKNIVVLLTNMPLPNTTIREWSEKNQLAEEGKLQAVELTITPDKQVISGQFWHKDKSFSATGMHEFTPVTFDGKIISGQLAIPAEHEFSGTTYQYNAKFAARVAQPSAAKTSGTPAEASAAEQSAQGRLYREYLKAMKDANLAAVREYVTKERQQELDAKSQDPEFKAMFDMLRTLSPKEVKLVRIQETGDKAELTATGKQDDGASGTGTISFVKEDGAWRILQDSWKWKSR